MAYIRRYIPKKPCAHTGCSLFPSKGCGKFCYKHKKEDPGYVRKQLRAAAKKDEKKVKLLAVDNLGNNDFQSLQNWFSDAARELAMMPVCQNCGALISIKAFRSATAHVLPKRDIYGFPSIRCHPLNRIFLGAECGCHKKYDSTWEQASQMKIWPLAVEIFIKIYPSIHPSEHKNIPEILRKHIPHAYTV